MGIALVDIESDKTLVASTGYTVIRCNNKAYNKYVFFFSQYSGFVDLLTQQATGASYPAVNAGIIKSTPIPLPPLETQRQIAANLDKVTHTIDLCNAILEKLDLLVKSRFVEMFGDKNNNKYRLVRLGDYASLQGGYAFKSTDLKQTGVKLVQIGNVNKDYLNWDDTVFLPNEYQDKYSTFALKENDLVLAMTRPVIKSLNSVKIAKVKKEDLPCLLNQRVGRFVIKNSLNHIYLENLCKLDDFRDYIEKMSGNSLQPNVSSKQVEEYMIILPPIELQQQFAAFVEQTDKSKSAVKQLLDKAETLKKALMQEYFG